jgi:diguanylate cyclase (GGDEF)-like protein
VLYASALLTRTIAGATTASSIVALAAGSAIDPHRTLVGYGPTAATLALTGYVVFALQRRTRELVARLEHLAGTDALTGLPNRRILLDTLERETAGHRRRHAALSLLMIDIDRFKRINDAAGHDAGDQALRRLGDLLRRQVRRGDLAARFGGEEFTLVMADCALPDAAARAEGLRALIAADAAGWPHPLTVSIGVAELPHDTPAVDAGSALIRHADEALYEAKQSGRNRVRTYEG